MPQDPSLYGQRPAKKQKKDSTLSSSLTFASELSSLLANPSSSVSTSAGRARLSKPKEDLFSTRKRKDGPRDKKDEPNSSKIRIKDVRGTEEEKQDHARARKKMEEKARLYHAMKRGDYIAKDNEAAPLVDFDRKWAERHPYDPDADPNRYSSSGSDNESEDDGDDGDAGVEMIEFKDEFGRTRHGTRAEVRLMQRRAARSALGARELDDMAAKPKAPQHVIYGDTIQHQAFNLDAETEDKMAELAAKRDKEPTPPPDMHFDGHAEIRNKGTGFYHFSKDEDERVKQMGNLDKERENTEKVRREREEERQRRKKEVEERRKRLGEKRAEKLADNFLDGLAGEIGAKQSKSDLDEAATKIDEIKSRFIET
ncbi:hypothetical protein GGR57DRAFT_164366 [Xylariaceae sp. FL1272]|nr:hypothetical protein GGR57DRAFT_164366 [Xylariaceae sp. FL1272]